MSMLALTVKNAMPCLARFSVEAGFLFKFSLHFFPHHFSILRDSYRQAFFSVRFNRFSNRLFNADVDFFKQ